MDQTTLSIDERRVRMSELVERLAALGLSVNFTPHYVELLAAHMFEDDAEGWERFQEDWLDVCEKLLTEEHVQEAESQAEELRQEAERQAAQSKLLVPRPPAKGPLALVDG